MLSDPANLASTPSEIGGYQIVEAYSEISWLATAPGGRRVVLKGLDEDCLWKGQLHPNVKDRLARVRELAHSGVANLYGVEREGPLCFLVWEYVEGMSLGEFAASPRCTLRDLMVLARELVLSVEVLHVRGIVHGMLKSSNIIITPDNRVVLTHVSPLLYSDPAQDVSTLVGVLLGLLEAREELDSPLGQILKQAEDGSMPLRRLAMRLGAAIDARDADPMEPSESAAVRRLKRRALLGAGTTALIGLALFVGLREYASARTPQAPVPPQASPAALQPAPPHGERGGSPIATRILP